MNNITESVAENNVILQSAQTHFLILQPLSDTWS